MTARSRRPRRTDRGRRRRRAARRDRDRGDQPEPRRGGGLQGLPDAQPHGVRRGRRGRRHRRRRHASTSTSTTPISGSDWLGDQDAIEAFVNEAPRELLQLEHWGCPWSRQPDGHIAVRAFGGMKKMRTWFAADKTGFHMLHTLFQTSLKYKRGHAVRRVVRHQAARRRRPGARRRGGRACSPARSRRSPRRPSSWPPAGAARSSRSPPTPTSTPATAWRWPTARARRSRTWSSSSTTRPACRSPAS